MVRVVRVWCAVRVRVVGVVMPCAPACTTNDVVAGLAQVSVQVQGLSAYLMVVCGLALCLLMGVAVLLFVSSR